MTMHFHTGHRAEADALVRQFHYSGRPPGSVVIVGTWHADGGLFGDSGECVAACYFGMSAARWSEPLLELNRLVRRDDVTVSLSGLISRTVKHIKRTGVADLLVSFADWTHDHHGGIYQAASWRYDGCRDRSMDGAVVGGKFVPGRSLNATYGTRSIDKLRAMGVDAVAHWDDGKHLYWHAINREGRRRAERLGLRDAPYPKPSMRQPAA